MDTKKDLAYYRKQLEDLNSDLQKRTSQYEENIKRLTKDKGQRDFDA